MDNNKKLLAAIIKVLFLIAMGRGIVLGNAVAEEDFKMNMFDPGVGDLGGSRIRQNNAEFLNYINNLGLVKAQQRAQQAQKAEEAQAEQAAMQKDLMSLFENPDAGARDFAKLVINYPKFKAQINEAWGVIDNERDEANQAQQAEIDAKNEEAQAEQLNQAGEVYSALSSGNPDVAINLLKRQAQAAENSGDAQSAKEDRDLIEMINIDPDFARKSIGLNIAARQGPEKFLAKFKEIEDRKLEQDKFAFEKNLEKEKFDFEKNKLAK